MPLEAENLNRAVEILKKLGKVYLAKNQYREAAGKFEDILRLGVKDTEVYRHLAVALAGQKLYTSDALRVYGWAVEKFPQDKNLCLHIAQAALHHDAEDEQAQRFYIAALKFHPSFAKDLYLQLHSIFHRRKKYDESFQALKQALYLEKSGEDQLVTRLTQLGWRYDRQQELLMTLQFLLGNNEKNPTIRRCLAFSLAHTIIRHHCKQKTSEVNLPYNSEADRQMLQAALPSPATLTTLDLLREYCTLKLALLTAAKSDKNFSVAPFRPPHKNYTAVTPKIFEYRALLDALPLEDILASSSSPPQQREPSQVPLHTPSTTFDWQRDFLQVLPIVNKTTDHDDKPADAAKVSDQVNSTPPLQTTALLILSPTFPHSQPDLSEASSHSVEMSMPQTIELITEHLTAMGSFTRIYGLSDGLMIFSSDVKNLANATMAFFKKISHDNALVPEKNQIALQAALHTLSQPRLAQLTPESNEENSVAGVELLYDGLHLMQAEHEEQGQKVKNHESSATCSRLLMSRQIFESAMGKEDFAVKYWGPAYWGAPGWHDEVCELVWYNPLDYASEKKPYALGRFLVMEKFHEHRTYGTYRTRDRSLERPVVLKALHPEIYRRRGSDESQRMEMVKTIRRLGRLEHPGIALIYDMGTHEDVFYYVREHIEGENLEQILVGRSRFTLAEAVRLLLEVCRILRYAHQNGIYHDNLKPSNIWRMKSSVVSEPLHVRALLAPPPSQSEKLNINLKISDFYIPGFNEISKTNWYYLAPELYSPDQANRPKTLRATADVYALGMILYDCLGGENPFKAIDFPVDQSSWEQAQLQPLSAMAHNSTGSSMLQALDEVIQRATDKDQFRRFQTIEEFEAALRRVLKEPSALIRKPMSLFSETR